MNDEIVQTPKEEYSYPKATITSSGLDASSASKSDTYGKFEAAYTLKTYFMHTFRTS